MGPWAQVLCCLPGDGPELGRDRRRHWGWAPLGLLSRPGVPCPRVPCPGVCPCPRVPRRGEAVPGTEAPLPAGAAGRVAAAARPQGRVRAAAPGGRAGARVAAVSGHHAGLHRGRLHLLRAHDQGEGVVGSLRVRHPCAGKGPPDRPALCTWARSPEPLPGPPSGPRTPPTHTLPLFFPFLLFSFPFSFSHTWARPLPVGLEHEAWGGLSWGRVLPASSSPSCCRTQPPRPRGRPATPVAEAPVVTTAPPPAEPCAC